MLNIESGCRVLPLYTETRESFVYGVCLEAEVEGSTQDLTPFTFVALFVGFSSMTISTTFHRGRERPLEGYGHVWNKEDVR
jgi:hypothetical protein